MVQRMELREDVSQVREPGAKKKVLSHQTYGWMRKNPDLPPGGSREPPGKSTTSPGPPAGKDLDKALRIHLGSGLRFQSDCVVAAFLPSLQFFLSD